MNKLFWGIALGLTIGVMANPLMPPAFFIIGGVALWMVYRKKERHQPPQRDSEG